MVNKNMAVEGENKKAFTRPISRWWWEKRMRENGGKREREKERGSGAVKGRVKGKSIITSAIGFPALKECKFH